MILNGVSMLVSLLGEIDNCSIFNGRYLVIETLKYNQNNQLLLLDLNTHQALKVVKNKRVKITQKTLKRTLLQRSHGFSSIENYLVNSQGEVPDGKLIIPDQIERTGGGCCAFKIKRHRHDIGTKAWT